MKLFLSVLLSLHYSARELLNQWNISEEYNVNI